MPIQSNASERYLHPHIYDWPLTPGNESAGLPLLDWEAGDASSVFEKLREAWRELSAGFEVYTALMGTRFEGVEAPGNGSPLKLHLKRGDDSCTEEADLLIVAAGFGRELSRSDLHPYWANSPLDATQDKKLRWLVSGAGDGGLTDLMRLCIKDFRHDKVVARFANDAVLKHELAALLEGKRRQPTIRATFEGLWEQMSLKIRIPEESRRNDTKVTFNAPDNYLESPGSSILNRFIVFQLEQLGWFERKAAKLKSPIPEPQGGLYKVQFEDSADLEPFDRLVIRHGPERAISDKFLATLWSACKDLRTEWQSIGQNEDRTRVPLFDPADYDLTEQPRSRHHLPVLASRMDNQRVSFAINPPSAGLDGFDGRNGLRYLVIESSRPRTPSVGTQVRTSVSSVAFRHHMRIVLGAEPSPDANIESLSVNTALSSQRNFNEAIRALCCADIAVMDVTGYEPGVMLLMGIRSVVRRGVTIVTSNKPADPAQWGELPFNIKDLYPLSIAVPPTGDANSPEHPNLKLGEVIAQAYRDYLRLPHYQDLPAYDPARHVHGEEGPVEPERKILWLCSFSKKYASNYYAGYIQSCLANKFGSPGRLERVIEIVSPQLLGQRLYSAIRAYSLCVVDWTFWSPNVFYEMGVRLAVSRFGPVCLLAKDQPELEGKPTKAMEKQRQSLGKLFAPVLYDQKDSGCALHAEVRRRYEDMRKYELPPHDMPAPPTYGAFSYHHTFREVARNLVVGNEPGAKPPAEVLSRLVDDLLGRQDQQLPGLPVLFANENKELAAQVRGAAAAFSIAVWRYWQYVRGRNSQQFLSDEPAMQGYRKAGERLVNQLEFSDDPYEIKLVNEVEEALSDLTSAPGRPATHDVYAFEVSKLRARRYRKRMVRAMQAGDQTKTDIELGAATKAIREALALLRRMGKPDLTSREPADTSDRWLATQLADCWGIRGGLYRARNDPAHLRKAIRCYDAGYLLESHPRFEILNSYNTVNRLVVRLLQSPAELGSMEQKFDEAIKAIQQQLGAGRPDRAWALADLTLLRVLRRKGRVNDVMGALFEETKSDIFPVQSLLEVIDDLTELQPKLEVHEELLATAEKLRKKTRERAPLTAPI